MMILWWTGKGWKAPAILLGILTLFGFVKMAAISLVGDAYWPWGVGFLVAAALNWHFGNADNQRATSRKMSPNLWRRLYYKPRNRFMSLPTET